MRVFIVMFLTLASLVACGSPPPSEVPPGYKESPYKESP
jgi:predicted small lipoprotein YifL